MSQRMVMMSLEPSSPLTQLLIMKMKFIFNVARGAFWLLVMAACTFPAPAQQPDVPSATSSASSPQTDPPASASMADPPPDEGTEAMFPHFKDTRFWLSGQTNFIFQTHPPFHAPYSDEHSLSPNYEKATSRVMTFYTGVRLNNSRSEEHTSELQSL